MKLIAQISRLLVGALFIVSGFIKANDPLGFSYKLEEYFVVFDMRFFEAWALPLAIAICVFEIVVGVALLLGAYTRLNSWLLLIMIVFFTWLTGYSAVTGKVTDCGCFGDAIKLTPSESFMKDLVLLVLILVIFIWQRHIRRLLPNNTMQGIAIFVALLVASFFSIYSYMFLPKIDFLPYKVGVDIEEAASIPEGAPVDEYEMVFLYKKDGKDYEFSVDSLPDDLDQYEFVDRTDKLIKKGYEPPIHDFKLSDANGSDYTESLFETDDYKLVLVQYDLEKTRASQQHVINDMALEWNKTGKEFWALTATPLAEVEEYRHEQQTPYDYYNMDATPLKSIVRSNPGLVLMKKATVVKKWSSYSLPTIEQVKKYME